MTDHFQLISAVLLMLLWPDQFLAQLPPKPIALAPGIISTSANEFGITFSSGMDEIFFARASGIWARDPLVGSIYYSRKVDGRWTKPEIAPFSSRYDDGDPHLTHDGRRLFFVSNRPSGSQKTSDDIWVVERSANGNWGEPVRLLSEINSDGREFSPRTTSSGDLYFASNREGGLGQGDLYFAKYLNGKFAQPENMGEVINSPTGEWNLDISLDGSVLIFESSGRAENLSSFGDLYISFKRGGSWTRPQNLVEVNSTGSDLTPFLDPTRKHLYFSSTRSRGSTTADLYQIEFGPLFRKYRESSQIPSSEHNSNRRWISE